MNRNNKILSLILAVQIILVLVIYLPRSDSSEESSGGALLADFVPEQVTKLTLTDDTGKKVVLEKTDDGNWVLPEYDLYPVEVFRVTSLLQQLAGLQTDRLITRSETSQRRLLVSGDEFVREIQIEQGDSRTTLYLGSPVSANTVHIRRSDQSQVYLVNNLSAQDASTELSAWINPVYVSIPFENMTRVILENANGTFEFTKEGENWVMAGLEEGETPDPAQITSFVQQVSQLRMQEPISRELKEEFGLESPSATVTIEVQEVGEGESSISKTYTYQLGAAQENGYVAKFSESDFYVRIAQAIGGLLADKKREDFLVIQPEATAEPTEEAAIEPTEEVTPEVTQEATEAATPEPIEEATSEPTQEAEN